MKSQTRRHRRRGKGSKTLRTSGGALGLVKDILRTGRTMSSVLTLGLVKGNESKTKDYRNSDEFNKLVLSDIELLNSNIKLQFEQTVQSAKFYDELLQKEEDWGPDLGMAIAKKIKLMLYLINTKLNDDFVESCLRESYPTKWKRVLIAEKPVKDFVKQNNNGMNQVEEEFIDVNTQEPALAQIFKYDCTPESYLCIVEKPVTTSPLQLFFPKLYKSSLKDFVYEELETPFKNATYNPSNKELLNYKIYKTLYDARLKMDQIKKYLEYVFDRCLQWILNRSIGVTLPEIQKDEINTETEQQYAESLKKLIQSMLWKYEFKKKYSNYTFNSFVYKIELPFIINNYFFKGYLSRFLNIDFKRRQIAQNIEKDKRAVLYNGLKKQHTNLYE